MKREMKAVGRYFGHVTESVGLDGHTIYVTLENWGITVAMKHVLCEDGKERTIYTREPDTFFTVPGYTSAYGKTVSGFCSSGYGDERIRFYATGKYKDFLIEKKFEIEKETK